MLLVTSPLSSRSFHAPIRKKGLAFWYCYRNAKSEVIQSFDYFLAQPQARQAYPSAFQEAQGTSKQTVTHSSPGEWQRKLSCTSHQAHPHRAADRKKTWFPYSQTPEGTHSLARGCYSIA